MTPFAKTFHVLKKPWFIILYIGLVMMAYYFIDKPVAYYFHDLNTRINLPFLSILTAFGKWKIYIIALILLGLYFRYGQKNKTFETRAWYLMACVFIPNMISFFIKVLLSRARPELLFSQDLYGFYWLQTKDLYWSFPSGHTVTITSLVAGLGVLFPKPFFAFLGLALLVIVTRVILYHHYVSDIMAGFYLSIIIVGVMTKYLKTTTYLSKI